METFLRLTRLEPHETHTFRVEDSLGVGCDFRGDEDVEDLTLRLPDDRPFRIDERSVEVEAFDDLELFT